MRIAAPRGYSTTLDQVRLRRPRPSDWGLNMTLCIAAIAQQGRAICLASDRLISFGYASSEFFNKASRISRRWGVMLAGDDVVCTDPIIEATKAIIAGVEPASRNLVERAIVTAIHAEY